jgi:PAS domain S-box-containing protein
VEIGEVLHQKEHLTEHLLATTTNPIYFYSLDTKRYSFLNHEMTNKLDYSESAAEKLMPTLMENLVHPDDASIVQAHYECCAKTVDGEVRETEFRLKHAFGEWHCLSSRDTIYTRFPDGRVKEILGVAEDISERRRNLEKIWYISTHDELTGLYNRIYYEEEVPGWSAGDDSRSRFWSRMWMGYRRLMMSRGLPLAICCCTVLVKPLETV